MPADPLDPAPAAGSPRPVDAGPLAGARSVDPVDPVDPVDIVEITHVQEFAASHRLHNPAWSADENRRLYGICNSENGHGHNWLVEVTVRGALDPESGMVMDLNRLRLLVIEKLIAKVDHLHLNYDVPFLRGVIPTAENIARAFWRELEPHLEAYHGCRLHRIRVRESRSNYADYLGPTRAGRRS